MPIYGMNLADRIGDGQLVEDWQPLSSVSLISSRGCSSSVLATTTNNTSGNHVLRTKLVSLDLLVAMVTMVLEVHGITAAPAAVAAPITAGTVVSSAGVEYGRHLGGADERVVVMVATRVVARELVLLLLEHAVSC